MPTISVCIPIYKSEKYIAQCAHSLFIQTLDDIEYIFINDCTPDKSIDILEAIIQQYPNRKNQIRIIHHNTNKGIAAVRNTALHHATAEYIIYCDSDDWVDINMYKYLYNKAIQTKADIVWCRYDTTTDPILLFSPSTDITYTNIDYIKKICLGQFHGSTWNKLIRKELLISNNLSFIEGQNILEDESMILRVLCFANNIQYVDKTLYHYIQHENSITRQPKYLEIIANITEASKYICKLKSEHPEIMKFWHWYEQRNKLTMMSCNGISLNTFKTTWPESTKIALILSNPTLRLHNKLLYCSLCLGTTSILSIKQFLTKRIKS